MNKLKMGLSAVIALFVFSLLSISALAAAPATATPSKITVTPNGEDKITITWQINAVDAADDFYLYWNGVQEVSPVITNLTRQAKDKDGNLLTTGTGANIKPVMIYEFEFIKTGLLAGENYKFAIEAVKGGKTSEKLTIDAVLGLNQIFSGKDTTPVDGINAHQTGFGTADNSGSSVGSVIKSIGMTDENGNPITHKTHGDYQNNTNSCASCHQTHTASSKNLLFKNGTYSTCTSCHDGTLGFYDVFAEGHDSGAGTFGGTEAGNMSSHMANGAVAVKAAPGGNKGAEEGSWTADFTCASCHSAHGSFSDRLLNVNPNGMAGTASDLGGRLMAGVTVVSSLPVPATGPDQVLLYQVLDGTEKNSSASPFYLDENATIGAKALVLYVKNGGAYNNGILLSTGSTFKDATDKTVTLSSAKYNPQGGYVIAGNVDQVVTADVAKPYIVKFNWDPVDEVIAGVKVKKSLGPTTATATELSGFCASCHTDYLAKSGGHISKWDSDKKIFGHTTNSANYQCVKCHFAHGTDVSIMRDAKGRNLDDLKNAVLMAGMGENVMTDQQARDYLVDKNPSSALKKFTNMSVCWACHNSSKSTQLINAPRDETHPYGFVDKAKQP